MMHHPSDAWLLDFACSNNSPLFDEILKAHVGICSLCRQTVSDAEELGGELIGLLGANRSCVGHSPRVSEFRRCPSDLEKYFQLPEPKWRNIYVGKNAR